MASMLFAIGRAGGTVMMTTIQPDLGALYLRYRDAMRRVAASVLREAGHASEAPDAVHDAIVSIMGSPPQNVRDWERFLITAAKRKPLDRVRSTEVRHAGAEFDGATHERAVDSDLAEDVAEILDRPERATFVQGCLSILDERHRKAVWDTVALAEPGGTAVDRRPRRIAECDETASSHLHP